MLHVDAERLGDEVRDDALVGPAELAGLHHSVELAVGPVDLIRRERKERLIRDSRYKRKKGLFTHFIALLVCSF